MTTEEARQQVAAINAGLNPEEEIEIASLDVESTVRLLLWADGRVTWK